jgi:hypothetical protein
VHNFVHNLVEFLQKSLFGIRMRKYIMRPGSVDIKIAAAVAAKLA